MRLAHSFPILALPIAGELSCPQGATQPASPSSVHPPTPKAQGYVQAAWFTLKRTKLGKRFVHGMFKQRTPRPWTLGYVI